MRSTSGEEIPLSTNTWDGNNGRRRRRSTHALKQMGRAGLGAVTTDTNLATVPETINRFPCKLSDCQCGVGVDLVPGCRQCHAYVAGWKAGGDSETEILIRFND